MAISEHAIAGAGKAARQSQVNEQVSSLEQAVESLHHSIDRLNQRISPVLKMSPPEKIERAPEGTTVVSFAEHLAEITSKIVAANIKVDEMFELCEL